MHKKSSDYTHSEQAYRHQDTKQYHRLSDTPDHYNHKFNINPQKSNLGQKTQQTQFNQHKHTIEAHKSALPQRPKPNCNRYAIAARSLGIHRVCQLITHRKINRRVTGVSFSIRSWSNRSGSIIGVVKRRRWWRRWARHELAVEERRWSRRRRRWRLAVVERRATPSWWWRRSRHYISVCDVRDSHGLKKKVCVFVLYMVLGVCVPAVFEF